MTERSKESQARKILEHLVFIREKDNQPIRSRIIIENVRYYYQKRKKAG